MILPQLLHCATTPMLLSSLPTLHQESMRLANDDCSNDTE